MLIVIKRLFQVRVYLILLFIIAIFSSAGCDNLFDKDDDKPKSRTGHKTILLPNGERVTIDRNGEIVPGRGQAKNLRPTNDADVERRARLCLNSMCDIETNYLYEIEDEDETYYLTPEEAREIPRTTSIFESQIWPHLETAIEDLKENSFEKYMEPSSDFFKLVSDDKVIKIDSISQQFSRLGRVMMIIEPFDSSDFDYSKYDEDYTITLKKEVLDTLDQKTRGQVIIAMSVVSHFVKITDETGVDLIGEFGLRAYLLKNHKLFANGGASSSDALIWFVASLQKQIDEIREVNPIFAKMILTDYGVGKLLAGEDLSRTESEDLETSMTHVVILGSFLKEAWPHLEKIFPQIETEIKAVDLKKMYRDFDEARPKKSEDERHRLSKNKTKEICLESIAAHLASLPKPHEVQESQKILEKLEVASRKVLEGTTLSPTSFSSEKISKLMDDLKFEFPNTRVKAVDEIVEALEDIRIIETHRNFKDLTELNSEESESLASYYFAFIKAEYRDEVDEDYEGLHKHCLSLLPRGLTDRNLTLDNKIIVSSKTVKNGLAAAGVFAHEIGHSVDAALKWQKKNPQLLQCFKSRHGYNVRYEKIDDREFTDAIAKGESIPEIEKVVPYVDEDFADEFSTQALKEAGLAHQKNNYGCLLLRQSVDPEDGYKYNIFGDSPHPLLAADGDDHSSPFFRLLQIAREISFSTPACESFKDQEYQQLYKSSEGKPLPLPKIQSCM